MDGAISDEPRRHALHARIILHLPHRRAARLSRCAEIGAQPRLWPPLRDVRGPAAVPYMASLIITPTALTMTGYGQARLPEIEQGDRWATESCVCRVGCRARCGG
jgi:hypothetical protein